MERTRQQNEAEIMPLRDFCKLYKVSRAMVYKLWSRKQGPPKVRLGNKIYIRRDGVKAWLDKTEKETK